MAELADALDSGSSGRKVVGVQVPVRAQNEKPLSRGFFLLCTSRAAQKFKLSALCEVPMFFVGILVRAPRKSSRTGDFSFSYVARVEKFSAKG